ncbi:(N-acetyl-beta-glucosaminyl)asparagine amidase [Seminavis robusta]|uniref:(N-acetyl-beta-glucosaminyl)asparagine amidase n=1 Tax=Seminavis robusta TaxID=568900 RepID=A0A9N8ER66_9STRA|nr:(N-acetyl-beta-glucosaminyl)asparagine amidase [Seminavis robusta]|eukprot:Sro1655_g288990.1 (N-acetyl-beta-glucosaminyl)asparagine amidase (322) ;mRNA; r:14091-15056
MASSSSSTSTSNSNGSKSKYEAKLRYNVDRFAKILSDEPQDSSLVQWLQESYGVDKTNQLAQLSSLSPSSVQEQKTLLRDFLEWFRTQFPYYRDTCNHCGAKGCQFRGNHPPTLDEQTPSPNTTTTTATIIIDTTEVSYCPHCQQLTRFPRYLSAMEIVKRQRGRCSEYSLLLYRILVGVLGLPARWIVDWANHVWAEVWIHEKWVHLDPCEASVDQPLLYQGWGKKQTYIVAFQQRGPDPSSSSSVTNGNKKNDTAHCPSSVVDVTKDYTSDSWETIQERRAQDGVTQEEIAAALDRANADLQQMTPSDIIATYSTSRTN